MVILEELGQEVLSDGDVVHAGSLDVRDRYSTDGFEWYKYPRVNLGALRWNLASRSACCVRTHRDKVHRVTCWNTVHC